MNTYLPLLAASASLLLFAGCATNSDSSTAGTAKAAAPAAIAVLSPTQGNTANGTVTFTRESGGMHIVAEISGLTPGEHGFHIHDKGDCSAPDATSAGGHFNPAAMPHGAHDAAQRHAGDLGNLTADASGKARLDRLDPILSFDGTNSIVGRAVIVHAKRDDLKTQPSGDAGARVACGVIQRK